MSTVLDTFLEHYLRICDELRLTEQETAVLWKRLKMQAAEALDWQERHPRSSIDQAHAAIRALTLRELAHVVSRTTHGTPIERKRNVVVIGFGGTGKSARTNLVFHGDTRICELRYMEPRRYDADAMFSVVDGGVFFMSAKRGIDLAMEMAWRHADEWRIPRIVFIHDSSTRVIENLVDMMRRRLRACAVPVYDRPRAINALRLHSPDVESHVGGFKAAVRAATISRAIVPVLCWAPERDEGIQDLLDAIVDYLPSPADRPSIRGFDVQSQMIERRPDEREPFTARCYRVIADDYRGDLACTRIYSGRIGSGISVFNATKRRNDRVGKLLEIDANAHQEIPEARAGDVVILAGLHNIGVGDVICDVSQPFFVNKAKCTETLVACNIRPKNTGDRDHLWFALRKLMREDPTLKAERDEETIKLEGTDEQHLNFVLAQVRSEIRSQVIVYKIFVLLKEKIARSVVAEVPHGDRTARVLIEPREEAGIEFVNSIASCYAFVEGIEEGLKRGTSGHPLTGVRALVDPCRCDRMATHQEIKVAAADACRRALQRTALSLVEPVMLLEVFAAVDVFKKIVGDLAKRQVDIQSIEDRPQTKVIRALAPLRYLLGYPTRLKQISEGRATCEIEFHDHWPTP